jgi:hypothetical protein
VNQFHTPDGQKCNALAADAPTGFEDPANDREAYSGEGQYGQKAPKYRDICDTIE